jgi:hypothetical protein
MNDLAFPIRRPLRRVEPGVVFKMTVSDFAPSCEFATHPTFKVIFIVVIIIHLSSIRVLDEIFSYHISNFNESLHHLLIVLVSNQVDGVIFCYSSLFRGDG